MIEQLELLTKEWMKLMGYLEGPLTQSITPLTHRTGLQEANGLPVLHASVLS